MAEKKKDSKEKNKILAERTSFFEWTVAAVGLILVLFTLGFVTYEAFYSKDTPPNLVVKSTSTKKLTEGYLIEFTVKNTGERTAANVIIEGKLSNGETKTITMDYVAAKSEQSGGLFFKADPRANNLEINTIGYVNP